MNQIFLLRMPPEKRRSYIVEHLSEMQITSLRRIATQYGINNSDKEKKVDLIDAITAGVLEWARAQDLAEVAQ